MLIHHTFLVKSLAAGLLAVLILPLSPAAADEASDYTRRGADSCLRCHDETGEFPVVDLFRTPHGSRYDPNSPFSSAQCETCHGPGADHERAQRRNEDTAPLRDFGRFAATPVAEQNGVCLDCHTDHSRLGWFGSAHDEQEVSCASCHQVHVEQDPVFDAVSQQEICFDCHAETRAQTLKPSAHPLRFGKMGCTDCHSAHDGNNDFQLAASNVNDSCYSCHAEKRGPFLWEHAPVPEDCTLCHDAHGSNHAAMLKQRPPLLCQQCHMPSGHPGVAYTSDAFDDGFQSRFLLGAACSNCHEQVHGSNHPSGVTLTR